MAGNKQKPGAGTLDRLNELSDADWRTIVEEAREEDDAWDKWIKEQIEEGRKNIEREKIKKNEKDGSNG